MSARLVLTLVGAAVLTAAAGWAVERDRGFVPGARKVVVLAPPPSGAPVEARRSAVMSLLAGGLPASDLPSSGPGTKFIAPPSPPDPSPVVERPAGVVAAPRVSLASVALTGKSPGSDERLDLFLEDATRCLASLRSAPVTGASFDFEKRVWKGKAEDLTLVSPALDSLTVSATDEGPFAASGAFTACLRARLIELRFAAASPDVVVRGVVVVAPIRR